MRFLLDTTFAIDFLRGDTDAVDRFAAIFEAGDVPCVNEVVLCELAVVIGPAELAGFGAFVRAVSFVQPGPDAAIIAGEWRSRARERGRVLSISDALIAAAAQGLDAPVMTRSRRGFELTPAVVSTY
jgi:predicted nucleic acid-binding protein